MSNNIFYDNFITKQTSIIIPMLQRDYVQAATATIIGPFMDKLLDSVKSTKSNPIDLNYIYGYFLEDNNNKRFIPIDGQQRLITLWIFHLYFYNKLKLKVDNADNSMIKLEFSSREYADCFVKELFNKIGSLEENLEDSTWFIKSWSVDITVKNIIKAWKYLWKHGNSIACENIQIIKDIGINFSFYKINSKANDIDESIYIKMNGRGRPLSYYDNLKSLMDKFITDILKATPDSNLKNWQNLIDNEWTDFFWNHKNENQEDKYQIDDEQVRFLYNMLILYWSKRGDELEKKLSSIQIDQELICKFLKISSSSKKIDWKTGSKNIIDNLKSKEYYIPLFWIEKLDLFNAMNNTEDTAFHFIYNSLEKLRKLNKFLNNNEKAIITFEEQKTRPLDLFISNNDKTSLFYKIGLDKPTNLTLCYLYVLTQTPDSFCQNEKNFIKWMRFFRNLLVNSTLGDDSLHNILQSISTVKEKLNEAKDDFSIAIQDLNNSNIKLNGFESDQVAEEIFKILIVKNQIDNQSLDSLFEEAEETYFNKGLIRFLFPTSILSKKSETAIVDMKNIEFNEKDFKTKFDNFKKFFDSEGLNKNNAIRVTYMRKFLYKWCGLYNRDTNNLRNRSIFYFDKNIRTILKPNSYFTINDELLRNEEFVINQKEYTINQAFTDIGIEDFEERYQAYLERFKSLIAQDYKLQQTQDGETDKALENTVDAVKEDIPNNIFFKTIFSNSFLGARLRFHHDILSFYKPYGTPIFLSNIKRDSILYRLYSLKEESNYTFEFSYDQNNTIMDYYKNLNVNKNDDDLLLPFLVGQDIEFKYNDYVFYWQYNNIIYIKDKNQYLICITSKIMNEKLAGYLNKYDELDKFTKTFIEELNNKIESIKNKN